MSVSEKKQNFKDTLIPIATTVYNELETQYLILVRLIFSSKNEKLERLWLKLKNYFWDLGTM